MLNNISFMFQALPSAQEDLPELKIKANENLGTFYIKVKGLDELYKALAEKVEIAVELRTTFYGVRKFAIKDLNDIT